MKIISKVQLHPTLLLFALLCIITGRFQEFIMISCLFLIHEGGHVLAGLHFHWKIERILFLPFGGMTVFQEQLNRPIREETWIVCCGPLFQCLGYFLLRTFFPFSFWYYHLFFLGFNLLPIIPLDGSKLLHLFLERYYPFAKSHQQLLIISFGFLSILFFYMVVLKNLVFAVAFFLLFIKGVEEKKQHDFLVERFCLERYLHRFSFPKSATVLGTNLKQMKRDHQHLFCAQGIYYTERELLQKKFQNKVYKPSNLW